MILLCYDGSDDAKTAIDRAAALFSGSPATVLTIWRPYAEIAAQTGFGFAYAMPLAESDEVDAQIEREARATAQEGAERATRGGLAAEARVAAPGGGAAAAILAIARELDADAIVVGTRGRGGLKSLLMGSTSHAVLQHADGPVVVVPSESVARARRSACETHARADAELSEV